MKRHLNERREAERLVPLIRSIGNEIRERSGRVDVLEDRLGSLSSANDEHRMAIRQLESELSIHRRELRRAEKELKELGCQLDADHPLRVLIPGKTGTYAYERLDKTSFYRATEQLNH
jgi:hypothetical protein